MYEVITDRVSLPGISSRFARSYALLFICLVLAVAALSACFPARSYASPVRPVGCFAAPGDCGYPDPTATSGSAVVGPIDGNGNSVPCSDLPTFSFADLDSYSFGPGTYWSGSGNVLEITGPNVTISDMNLGNITIYVSSGTTNFTLDSTCMNVVGTQSEGSIAINISGGVTGTTIEHSTISGTNATTHSLGQAVDNNGTGTTIEYDYVYNVGGGAPGGGGGDATVENNYELINATVYGTGTPPPEEHYEAIYCSDNTLTISHNTLLNPHDQTAAIFCDTGGGSGGACDNHLTITNNLMAGGDYLVYPCGNASSVGTSTSDIESNRFARCDYGAVISGGADNLCPGGADANGYYPYGGSYSVTAYYYTGTGQTWSDNYWDDSLDAVNADGSTGSPVADVAPICVVNASQSLCRIGSTIKVPSTNLTAFNDETLTVDGIVCDVTVQDGGTLKGNGSMCGLTIDGGAIVAPGHSPGTITVNNNLTESGTYDAQIQSPGTVAGTDYDQIVVKGSVTLTGGSLDPELLGGFVPAVGQSFKIIDKQGAGAVTGTFNGLAEGAVFKVGNTRFQITYKGGDGNDVVLTVVSPDTPVTATIPRAPDTGFATSKLSPIFILLAALAGAAILAIAGYNVRPRIKNFR